MGTVKSRRPKTMILMTAPFPYFGGKASVADLVWQRFGVVQNYVEPFFGSGAVLLANPNESCTETCNDKDGMVSNFWRAVAAAPEQVAHYADWPVNECDLHARHIWLLNRKEPMQAKLEGDPDYYDAQVAGWWVWGICQWIAGGWCSGEGSWNSVDGVMTKTGKGAHRKLPHLRDAGKGVHRKRPSLQNTGKGVHRGEDLVEWMRDLSRRLRYVRVCCGDWSRVTGPSVTIRLGTTAVFLDPPYSDPVRDARCYAVDSVTVAKDAAAWALEWGKHRDMRIALCGYEGEHELPGWAVHEWRANGGYGNQSGENKNKARERIWFSPHCLRAAQMKLFQ